MNVLGLLRQLQVNELHVLDALKAEIVEERLQESLRPIVFLGCFRSCWVGSEGSTDRGFEDEDIFDTTTDSEELQYRLEILAMVNSVEYHD